MSVREDQVEAAVRFLSNPAVKDRSPREKQEFLLGKGLNQEEVDEAVRRNSGGGSSGSTSTGAVNRTPSVVERDHLPSSVPVASGPPSATLPGGYPAPVGMAPGGYAPPTQQMAAPGMQSWQPAVPMQMQLFAEFWLAPSADSSSLAPFPQQLQLSAQANSSPWWTWLLGGLSFGSLLALLVSLLWPRRPPQAALHSASREQLHRAAWASQVGQVSAFPSSLPTGPPPLMLPPPGGSSSSAEPVAAAHVEDTSSSPSTHVARLDELAGYIRRHVEETREASSSLRRTLESQQRLYQATLSDFQRRVDDASKRKPAAPTPRIEIAPESMKMLKSLLHRETNTNGTCEPGRAPEESETLRHWFSQVEEALERHLRDAPSKVEAKKSLQTLCLIVSNVVTNSQQEKFREVNTATSRFREQLGTPDGGAAELLQLAGFERRESSFVFPEGHSLEKAERVRDFLQASVRDCDRRWQESHAATESSAPEQPEAVSPPRPPWASSISSASMVNGTSSNIAASSNGDVAPPTDSSSKPVAPTATASKAPAAPWLSSAMQRGLQQRGLPQHGSSSSSNGHAPAETGGEAHGSTSLRAVHPAESAGIEETQRAPG